MNDIWLQILTIIGANLAAILTFFGIAISLHISLKNSLDEMKNEMKDFHGRMCSLEERRRTDP